MLIRRAPEWTRPLLTRTLSIGPNLLSPSVCVVGGGPAGFYCAQHVANKGPAGTTVDIVEKLPVPFGLVRFGVAPDHPEVKNVESTFAKVAESKPVRFFGDVSVGDLGRDDGIRLADLRLAYDAVVLAHGAAEDRALGIPGENLANVIPARSLVDLYNGAPDADHSAVDLTCSEDAVVVGAGNVALDVARILLSPASRLKGTDIPDSAVAALKASKIRRVHVVGKTRKVFEY